MSKIISFFIILTTSYFAFLFHNLYLYHSNQDSSWGILTGLAGIILVIEIITLLIFDSISKDDDENGGKRKIYPDNSDYSEKTLELMR